ncbi:hypothetical protein VTK26DRAFT_1235 [Humicola hyalothermophila]
MVDRGDRTSGGASSEMGCWGAPATGHAGLERDGAISTWPSLAAQDGLMSGIDAHGARPIISFTQWMREHTPEAEPGAATPTGHPLLEAPLATALLDDESESDCFSLQLPHFVNTNKSSSRASPQARSPSCRFPDHNACNSGLAPHADCLPLFYTFYLSPSETKSSIVPSLWSSELSGSSDETDRTMSTATFHARDDQLLLPSTTDYSSTSACASRDAAHLRPHSTDSGKDERTASALTFGRWGRRHYQQHQKCAASHQNGDGIHESKASNRRSSPRRTARPRSSSSAQNRQTQAGAVPQMTREEFEALPLAIQRKYFSTLERLRFAQESGLVNGLSQHYDEITLFRRRKHPQDGTVSEYLAGRNCRRSVLGSHSSARDSSPSSTGSSEATQDAESGCEQEVPGRRSHASVILDPADEAVYRLYQRASRRALSTTIDTLSPPLTPRRNSMDSVEGVGRHYEQPDDAHVPQSFYDSFRWLDEEEDLDLRLFLDDYHANLRESAGRTKQRPSFRRHMSISKLPFGRRSSFSSSRPETKDATTQTPAVNSPRPGVSNPSTHARRKSRALSLITPRHAPRPSITAFDPAAAHYQDPEARLKLRVYLASPQKFDEAVEFGFPAADVLSPPAPHSSGTAGHPPGQPKQKPTDGSPNLRTFLADDDDEDDDNLSLGSDQPSLADPDSPKTPEPFESRGAGPHRHGRFASADVVSSREFAKKAPERVGYTQAPASSREMTLRMTLTRPDLRAHEDDIYGWQQKQAYQQHSRRPTTVPSHAAETSSPHVARGAHSDSQEGFSATDRWNATTTEKGVMKRFWNRVWRI